MTELQGSHMSTLWRMEVAKKRKFKHALGMSTTRASQTGLPWSWDSACAKSSNLSSIKLAIFSMILLRSAAAVCDQLREERRETQVAWAKRMEKHVFLHAEMASSPCKEPTFQRPFSQLPRRISLPPLRCREPLSAPLPWKG